MFNVILSAFLFIFFISSEGNRFCHLHPKSTDRQLYMYITLSSFSFLSLFLSVEIMGFFLEDPDARKVCIIFFSERKRNRWGKYIPKSSATTKITLGFVADSTLDTVSRSTKTKNVVVRLVISVLTFWRLVGLMFAHMWTLHKPVSIKSFGCLPKMVGHLQMILYLLLSSSHVYKRTHDRSHVRTHNGSDVHMLIRTHPINSREIIQFMEYQKWSQTWVLIVKILRKTFTSISVS